MNERGGIKIVKERVYARVRYGKTERLQERLPWATPAAKTAARARAVMIADFCDRMRVSELLDADWWQFNVEVATFTATKTKTGDPRMWALRPDVARAMRTWKERYGQTKARPFSDVLAEKDAKLYLAERLRESLALAEVTRRELFESTEFTGKLRAHDMRATFVTVSLAEGKSDTWIRDRTAHKTTGMIDRYRRTARQFAELKLGSLIDLDQGLGWGISWGIPTDFICPSRQKT